MRYIVDNDLHIHTYLSPCSQDREQTPENILKYALKNSFKNICITDHYWDSKVPGASTFLAKLDTALLKKALPLPKAEGVRFMFGCETELDKHGYLAIHRDTCDEFDFIVIPINHFHMEGFTLPEEDFNNVPSIAKRWVERFEYVLGQDLPFHKVGLAHLGCELMVTSSREGHLEVLDMIRDEDYVRLFSKAAKAGVGIELNFETFFEYSDSQLERLMRPFRLAKSVGCKFYFGSDAHHPSDFERAKEKFEKTVDLLDLTEDDKFRVGE